jgi:hypothetical protein
MNAEAILETLAKLRQSIPYKLVPVPESRSVPSHQSVADFEEATIVEELERLTAELTDALDAAHDRVLVNALEVYYATEALARDPENAHLIPHVEAMRRAFEHDYGIPIPER